MYKNKAATLKGPISVRFRETVKRVDVVQPLLDIGEPNYISRHLNAKSTDGDLNYTLGGRWQDTYNTITCFEVIEHVQNPLALLEMIRITLKPGGVLYLTTPHRWWMGLGKHHFKEFTIPEIRHLFALAGLRILHLERIRGYNFKFTGVRPFLRLFRDLIKGQCIFIKAGEIE